MADKRPGFVSLVGAGPGDPGLLTIRGRRVIKRADVVLYDRLASASLLAAVPVEGQERIHVGKTAGPGASAQADINALMVRRAQGGARVVRLKGGDPFLLGRGGEEAEACAQAGIPFEIVPGVSSACAVPAYAGIPVTHRQDASTLLIATGHERADTDGGRVPWNQLGHTGGTVVVLMGVLQLQRWTTELMGGGLSPETPVALIRWGTTPQQRTLVATVGTVADRAADEGVRPPVVAVVGDVVRRREALAWFDTRPLFGQVIGTTRSGPDDDEAFTRLEDLGAVVLHVPLVRQELSSTPEMVRAIEEQAFTDLVFTSGNGVRAFARALARSGGDARSLHGVHTWAVGPGTARVLRSEVALGADHLPETASGEGLVDLASVVGVEGRRFLFPAAAGARDIVPVGLRALGAEVEQITGYVTVADPLASTRLQSALDQGLSLVAIASPSAARALTDALTALGRAPSSMAVAAIGPTTAGSAREMGLNVEVVAETHTMTGLAQGISQKLGIDS